MAKLEVTYGGQWSALFLPGIPPAGLLEEQFRALMELASIYGKRVDTSKAPLPPNHGTTAGGWSIRARTGREFDDLHDITAAILSHEYKPLAAYRDDPQP